MKENNVQKKNNRKRRGFTLIELVIVVAIIGVLALIAIPQFTKVTQDAKNKTFDSNCQILVSAIGMYQAGHNGDLPDDEYPFTDEIKGGIAGLQQAPTGATYDWEGGKLTCNYPGYKDDKNPSGKEFTYPDDAAGTGGVTPDVTE